MKPATISQLKAELAALPQKEVAALCLRLAKYKKENKELLAYLLFDAHDVHGYTENIKQEINGQFAVLPQNNWYFLKKGLRKILRSITKYSKHIASKEAAADLLFHFCFTLKHSNIPFQHNAAINKLYINQTKKLYDLTEEIHEDLQYDFRKKIALL